MKYTLYILTDINPTNAHIDVFGHKLGIGENNDYEDTDYTRKTYIGYDRMEAVFKYISDVVGDVDTTNTKIVISKF